MMDRFILFFLKNKPLINTLLILTTLIILFLTMFPSEQMGDTPLFDYDKIGHFMIFFGWTFLYGLFTFNRKSTETRLMFVFFAGCFFGIIIEIFQGILPIGRSMDIYDTYADILGSLLAILCLIWIRTRYINNKLEQKIKNI